MAAEVSFKDKGWNSIKKQLIELDKKFVYVGIQGANAKINRDGAPLVEIATWNHFGTEHIPERPFLTATIRFNKSQIKRRIATSIRLVTSGKATAKKAQIMLGEYVVGLVQDEIAAWVDPPNAESTVKAKGFNNPLIQTGTLRRSITFEVK